MRAPDELRALVEEYLGGLALTPELHGQAESVRYALEGGGKRVRPVLCLATAEAAGASRRARRCRRPPRSSSSTRSRSSTTTCPRSTTTSERRGRPSTWAQYGEAVAILAGRRAARRGVPARALVSDAARGPRARRGDARDDRRPVPRHHRHGARRGDAAPAEDGLPVRGRDRARALGRRGARGASRRRGARSATSSASCSRSSTTSSTATATWLAHGADGARAARRRGGGPRAGRARARSTRTRRCSRRSSSGLKARTV